MFDSIRFLFLSPRSGSPPYETYMIVTRRSTTRGRESFRWKRSTTRGEEEKAHIVEPRIREAIENEEAETD
ncbi:hypothetical protein RYX36_028990 [Vicia faba]